MVFLRYSYVILIDLHEIDRGFCDIDKNSMVFKEIHKESLVISCVIIGNHKEIVCLSNEYHGIS